MLFIVVYSQNVLKKKLFCTGKKLDRYSHSYDTKLSQKIVDHFNCI